MKQLIFLNLASFLLINFSWATALNLDSIRVTDAEATKLFRYVGGAFPSLPEDEKNQILQTDLMMCSILFNGGGGAAPKVARCLLPNEQIRFDKDIALEVTEILKKYKMPSHFTFGYETVEAGLDCTSTLKGNEAPICFLSPPAPKR